MSESEACLAITERKPQSQRPGGCVGIFFQLFDWNRRFAKKKLFSKKLLPPARAKKAAKNLGGDDKMPKAKLHLIGDENGGGLRNGICGGDSGRRHEMKPPSLVARLMGLESMPASLKEKPKKVSMPESVEDDVNRSLEKGSMKVESRPQKLQKTGAFERQAVTRFGAEAFQIKNVLSRSRKHQQQHPKLASPVKSPRASTGRNVSRTRLIDVATRILEPGLQATNRARCSLTYHPGSMGSLEDEVGAEATRVRSPEPFEDPGYNASEGKSLACQASCKNCGESLDVMNFRSYEADQCAFPSSAPNFVKVPCEGSGRSEPRAPVSFLERENDAVSEKPVEKLQDIAGTYREGKFVSKAGQERWSSPTKPWKSSNDKTTTALKHKVQDHNRMSLGKERVSSRTKYSELQSRRVSMAVNAVSEPKDFVSLNRNLSGRTQPRVPPKAGKSNLDNQRKTCDMVDDSLPKSRAPVRKRRSVNAIGHNDRNLQSDAFTRREMRVNPQFTHRSMPYRQERSSRVNGNKDGDVVSFSFNSPLRNKIGSTGSATTTTSGKRRDQKGIIGTSTSHQRKLILDVNNGETHFQEPCPMRGDALSALLEQKLMELTSQEEEESTTGASQSKKSTAMILQELITALNAEQPASHDFLMSGTNTPLQAKAMNGRTFTYLRDEDHFSPGSVLEASFSNDSCFSSSIDESSGPRMDLDSATSWSEGKACTEMVSDLVNHISQVLQTMNLAGLIETKITHAREVIFNTELLFGNAASPNSDFLVGPFLLDELERFVRSTQPHYARSLNHEKTKEGLLRGFLFDSMIECLDSKYGRYGSTGFETWRRLPLQVDEEALIGQVDEDIGRWTEMVGKAPDEIVEWEMSHGLGKWVDFDAEVFESGEEIDNYILEFLVEEIVLDL